jgi:hypothetical protein
MELLKFEIYGKQATFDGLEEIAKKTLEETKVRVYKN